MRLRAVCDVKISLHEELSEYAGSTEEMGMHDCWPYTCYFY